MGYKNNLIFFLLTGISVSLLAAVNPEPVNTKFRVLLSSDIGGSDEDDMQSFVHYLVYSDMFDTEGLVSSPPGDGRKKDYTNIVKIYEKDYELLKQWSNEYPTPDYLNSITKQGAVNPAPDTGYSKSTEGSEWIVKCANKADDRPLYVLVWGAITDLAQALHDDPSIKSKIRVYFIASWNRIQDMNAFNYIDSQFPNLWIIQNESTFRGWYVGGYQTNGMDNSTFITKYVQNCGDLGAFFSTLNNGVLKMGDSPSVGWLLFSPHINPMDQSWGGQFVKVSGRPNWYADDYKPELVEDKYFGAKTVNLWRKEYLTDWAGRMKRCKTAPSEAAGQ